MTRFASLVPVFLLAFGSVGCAGDDGGGGRGARGNGNGSGGPGSGNGSGLNGGLNGGFNPGDLNGGSGGGCDAVLKVVYRDFQDSHPDFEMSATHSFMNDRNQEEPFEGWNDMGCELVEPTLGANKKPVFFSGQPDANDGVELAPGVGRRQRVVQGNGCWPQAGDCYIGYCQPWEFSSPRDVRTGQLFGEIRSAETFNQWYNDVPGVNERIELDLELTESATTPGMYVYDSNAFFPIDGMGFGNTPGWNHNYHFTTEIHLTFTYRPGTSQRFTFRGDDDLWIFVNGRLALDVGGLHQALEGTIDFDLKAQELGIQQGGQFEMSIFHAERQTTDSNFRIETTIGCFTPIVVR